MTSPDATPPFAAGLRLHERYLLRARIGLGGMSEVWSADDEVLDRPVAVKALAAPLAADPDLRATLRREARAAARLNHPHITQVYDYGEAALPDEALRPYLVMELVRGQGLAARLAAGPLPWPVAVRTVAQVASALAAAHAAGLVHRDVKPGNVMLTPNGAKVLDFGLAALAGTTTPAGAPRIGTPAYAAPERTASAPPKPATDVYALGVLLHEVLTGRTPRHVRSWADVTRAHREAVAPLDVPGLPPGVAAICAGCLARDPRRRPTAAAVAAGLTEVLRPDRMIVEVRDAASGGVGRAQSGASGSPSAASRSASGSSASRSPSAASRWASAASRSPSAASRWASAAFRSASAASRSGASSASSSPGAGSEAERLTRAATVGVAVAGAVALLVFAMAVLTERGAGDAAAGAGPEVGATGVAATGGGPAAGAAGDPSGPAATPGAAGGAAPGGPGSPGPVSPAALPATAPSTAPAAGVALAAREVVTRFDLRLSQALAAGQVRQDVALDLRNKLVELRNRLDRPAPDLRDPARELRRKLGERRAEGAIDARAAADLDLLLVPLT
jgi:serine/threonine-protein kinase